MIIIQQVFLQFIRIFMMNFENLWGGEMEKVL